MMQSTKGYRPDLPTFGQTFSRKTGLRVRNIDPRSERSLADTERPFKSDKGESK